MRATARSALAAIVSVGVFAATVGGASAQAIEPVDGTLVDAYRPPAHIGAPGNRGWEYATDPGGPVRVVFPGVVAFAGRIGDNLYVSVDHGGGLRTTYSFVAALDVRTGDTVVAGQRVATTGSTFHLGVRRDGLYIDPAHLFGGGVTRVWLVPRGPGVTASPSIGTTPWAGAPHSLVPVSLSPWWQYTLRLAQHRVD